MGDKRGTLNEGAVFACVAAFVLLSLACLWGFGSGVRDRALVRAVNTYLSGAGTERRAASVIRERGPDGKAAAFGTWLRMEDGGIAVVFAFAGGGLLPPCLAVMGADGRTASLIPLSPDAEFAVDGANPGYLRFYIGLAERHAASVLQAAQTGGRR
jgi:hypothetical protein